MTNLQIIQNVVDSLVISLGETKRYKVVEREKKPDNEDIAYSLLGHIETEYEIDNILSRCQNQTHVEARQIAMYLMRNKLQMQLAEIARVLDRNHATIIYGVDAVSGRMDVYPAFHAKVSALWAGFQEEKEIFNQKQ